MITTTSTTTSTTMTCPDTTAQDPRCEPSPTRRYWAARRAAAAGQCATAWRLLCTAQAT